MGLGTVLLIVAVVLFVLVAANITGPTIEGVQAIPAGLAFFAASFFPFGVIALGSDRSSRNDRR